MFGLNSKLSNDVLHIEKIHLSCDFGQNLFLSSCCSTLSNYQCRSPEGSVSQIMKHFRRRLHSDDGFKQHYYICKMSGSLRMAVAVYNENSS